MSFQQDESEQLKRKKEEKKNVFWKVTLNTSSSSGLPTVPRWCEFCPPQLKSHFSASLFHLNKITQTAAGSSDIYLTIITLRPHTLSIFNKISETIFCSQQQIRLLVPIREQINKWKLRTTYFSEGQQLRAKRTSRFERNIKSISPSDLVFFCLFFSFYSIHFIFAKAPPKKACLNENVKDNDSCDECAPCVSGKIWLFFLF